MSEAAEIEKDPMLMLLTDALRAGPGTPVWHEAIEKLRASGASGEEHQMLVTAREHLASGRDYRSVRAGPNFTRKVMEGIEEGGQGSKIPTTAIVGIFAAVLLVVALVCVVFWMVPSNVKPPVPTAAELDKLLFVQQVNAVSFDTNESLGTQWRKIGPLGMNLKEGLTPATDGAVQKDYIGGAVVSTSALPAKDPVSVEVTMRCVKPSPEVIVQVFVTDTLDFSADRATGSNELVWQWQEGKASVVLPGGRGEGKSVKIAPSRQLFTVRLAMNGQFVTVDSSDRLYAGPIGLSDKPRYVGVRFLRKGNDRGEIVNVQSVRVMKP